MNLIDLFKNAVSDFPGGIAIKGSNFSFSYGDFDAITHNFAYQLIAKGVRQDDIVGMCIERSPEMLVGIFGILKAGAAYLPVDASNPPKRIVSLLNDAGVKWIVTSSGLSDFVSALGFLPVVPDCSVPASLNTTVLPVISGDATAYVLFTSGSTGTPKGVLISHSSVVNLLVYMQEHYPLEQGDRVMLKSPYTFDGSIWELFGWMKMGGTLFVTPEGAEKDPGKLSEIIEKEKIGFLFFVPSMLNVFTAYCALHKTSFDSLKWVSVGGEVLPVSLVNAFYQLFDYQKVKLINVYGPTETTVYATTYCCIPGVKSGKIPIGNAVTNNAIYIVDEFLHAVPEGQEGEICIGGAGVGKGYLNRPELTAEKFVEDSIAGTGKMYRTGDFGRRNENGQFDFIGRRDFQIKLRGLRIETGEIEHALLQFDGIAECVVLMLKDGQGDDRLTAYLRLQTTDPGPTGNWYPAPGNYKVQLTTHLLEWLPSYMHPSDYIIYKSFPLTAHGKIDRAAFVQSWETGITFEEKTHETATETESMIRNLWQAVTGKKHIGLHEDFFATGGHSLKVIQLITLIIRETGHEVPIRDFYDGITISSMSEQIDHGRYLKVRSPEKPVKSDVRQTVFPLTPVQTEMWIMNSIDDTGLSHNIQVEFTLVGQPDIERFKQSVVQTVQHEEMFRSVFEVDNEVPVQHLCHRVEVNIPEVDLSKTEPAARTGKYNEIVFAHGNTLFDLDKLPLFSFIFIKWSENEHRLLVTVHHLIFDGWSLHLFMKRIASYYLHEMPEEPAWRNADYALYLRQPEVLKRTIKELEFWTNSLKDIPAFLSLPQKPQVNSAKTGNRGDRLWWTMSKELSAKIDQFALATRTTPFVVFMSAYQLALAAAANQHDIVVGSPLANRNNNMITDLIGYYTNMVCIRGSWDGSSSVLKVIENCNTQIINAFSNSTVSYGEIAKRLNKKNGIAFNSVFHAIFVMQNWPHDNLELPGFSLTQREIGNNTAKTGFLFNAEYRDGAYVCWLEYDTGLYTSTLAEQISKAITRSIRDMIENPQTNIGSLEQRIKDDLEFADNLTCYVVGEGQLAAQCIKILDGNKIKVLKVISVDDWLLSAFKAISLHGDALADGLLKLEPVDYIFSISNSIILKKEFISLAKIMAVNYHDAPLPRYAGMYATNWAIINGEETHGIAWHKITDKVDAGDIVESRFFKMEVDETAFSLNTKCFDAAIDSFEKLVNSIIAGSVSASAQNLSERTYHALGSRPRFFGCISPAQSATTVDRLLRATNFGGHNANEFALPLLFVNGNFYTIAKARVLSDLKGPAGRISHAGGNPGFFCDNGFIVPEIIYNSRGIIIPAEELLATVKTIPVPDQHILAEAGTCFSAIAKYESYWKKQLLLAEYATWPVLSGEQIQHEATLSFDLELFDLLRQIFPEYDIQDTVTAVFCMFLLRMRDADSGTFGYMPAGDISPLLRQTEIFGSVVPFTVNLREGEDSVKAISRTLSTLKRTREAQTFTRSICLRYPELKGKATSRPEIVITNEEIDLENTGEGGVLVSITGPGMKIFSTNPNRFGGLQAFTDHFISFLGNYVPAPSASFAELPFMSPASIDRTILTLQSSPALPLVITNVVSAFREVVQKYPDHVAVFDAGNRYSYRTFSNDIARLSVRLSDMGVDNKVVAAVSIERSYHYFLSIMAILHCGAAFLPVDPKMPVERKKFICENAGASVLLIENEQESLKTGIEEVVVSQSPVSAGGKAGNFQMPNPEDIAYIIYTSGSTGRPKGVKISNRNLANFISGAIHLYQIGPADRILQFSNLSFDASIEEIFCSFCTGASLYLRTEEMLDPVELIQFADQHNITVLDLPTFFWRRMIRTESVSSLQNKVKLIIVGGEALSPADVNYWNSIDPGISLINTYGPTETTVVALACKITPTSAKNDFVPIGRPLPGYIIFIVDKQRNILPPGVAGELLIAGNGVTPGYVNELNDKAFVWINTPKDGPVRCYCTGDSVYSDDNGIVYFLGRIDHQLKIRGYRVEPGEIEYQICKLDGIETCSVLPGAERNGEVKLIAFYQSASHEVSPSAFKIALKPLLPPYMIPDIFVKIETMPLTPNGKIDKSRLLATAMSKEVDEPVLLDGPTNETEEYLLALWRRILGNPHIGIHDDFFEIGGHSLKAVTLMAEIKKDKGIKIPLASLIQHATINKFARLVLQENKQEYWNCLVPVRPAGNKTPIFLIHGAGLNILLYKSLANHLSADRPIYAFQASGLDGSKQFKTNLHDIAEEYIRELLRIQPDGPFLLMGFSLGGFIAYEMAMQLVSRGLTVKFTGLIDSVSFLARYSNSYAHRIAVTAQGIVLNPFYLIWLYFKEPNTEKRRFMKNKYKNIRLTITYYLVRLGLVKRKNITEELDQMSFLSDNMRITLNENLKKYELKPAPFHIDLFVAGKPTFYIHERKTYGWAKFAKQGLTIHTIPSEHSLMFAPPYDAYFAELLERRLDQIETGQT